MAKGSSNLDVAEGSRMTTQHPKGIQNLDTYLSEGGKGK